MGTYTLLEAALAYWRGYAERARGFRFQHISTDEVFGSLGPDGKFSENALPAQLALCRQQGRVRPSGARLAPHLRPADVLTNCSNNYGPYHFPEKLIPLVILRALRGEPAGLRQGRERARLAACRGPCRGADAVLRGAGPARPTMSAATASGTIRRRARDLRAARRDAAQPPNRPHENLIEFVTDRPGHDARYAIDAGKIQRELGWRPRHKFENGLRETVALVPRQPRVVGTVWSAPIAATARHRPPGGGNPECGAPESMTYPSHLIPTTVVGSYPQPDWLSTAPCSNIAACRASVLSDIWRVTGTVAASRPRTTPLLSRSARWKWPASILSATARSGARAIRTVLLLALDGIDFGTRLVWSAQRRGTTPVPRVVGRIKRAARSSARRRVPGGACDGATKITIPGPFTMSQQAENAFYADEEEMAMDYAAAVNGTARAEGHRGRCRAARRALGAHRARKAARWGVAAINRALDGIPGPPSSIYASATPRWCAASLRIRLPAAARRLLADQISIEAAQPRLDLGVSKDLSGKTVLLGVLDLDDHTVETAEHVAARLRAGLRLYPGRTPRRRRPIAA